jgi:predicted nucleic acid-binding protein
MATKLFLDTNIILDILDNKRPAHSQAYKIWEMVETNIAEACISESVLTATDYILKKVAERSIRVALFADLLKFLDVLPCSTDICRKALRNNFSDFEDTILYQVAIEGAADFFITNDTNALKKLSTGVLPVLSAKQFLVINS